MCLLVAQTMASELLLGGGVHEDYFSRLTFSLKRGTILFVSFHSATTIFVLKRGYASLGYIFFPCCSSRRVFFFASQACPTKIASPFVGGAVQTGFVCLHVFSTPCHWFLAQAAAVIKQALFAVYVDSINNISWSKRKVGPMVYVTELGTLESATAP